MNRIEQQINDMITTASKMQEAWANAPVLHGILQSLEKFGDEINVSLFDGSLWLSFAGDKHRLADVVRILRTAGFDTDYNPPEAKSTGWVAKYTIPESTSGVYVNFTSSVCVRRQVGVETKEVPVYEVVCE